NLPAYPATLGPLPFILHNRPQVHGGGIPSRLRTHVALPLSEVQRIGLGEPHVPVNSRAFVEPAVAKTRVHAHYQIVLAPVVQIVGEIETERRVAVVVAA